MSGHHAAAAEGDAMTIYCTHCGQPMRVASTHMHGSVACPHCSARVEPQRMQTASHEAATMPYRPIQQPHPVHLPPHRNAYGEEYSWRNRWIAGALAILLGYFGVHRFYTGHTGIGLTQCLITVLSVGFLSPVVYVWAFIEGILCFTGAMRDVEGRPLQG